MQVSIADINRFWALVDIRGANECWPWRGATPGSSVYFKLNGKAEVASRVAWCIAHGDPGIKFVLHKCDVSICMNQSHLYLGNQARNVQDRVDRNRSCKGEHSPSAVLTIEKVKEIRQLQASGWTQRQIAWHFKVSRGAIQKLIEGRSWRHV